MIDLRQHVSEHPQANTQVCVAGTSMLATSKSMDEVHDKLVLAEVDFAQRGKALGLSLSHTGTLVSSRPSLTLRLTKERQGYCVNLAPARRVRHLGLTSEADKCRPPRQLISRARKVNI